MKGDIAPYAVFIVILIGASIAVIIAVSYHWIGDILPGQASQFSCGTKILNYCTEYQKKNWDAPPYTYSDKNPKECEKYTGVPDSGPSAEKCKELLGVG